MASFNFTSLLYVGFRLAPFILMSFFTLSSVINTDIKGILLLAMILVSCLITIMVGNFIGTFIPESPLSNALCNTMNLSEGGPVSKILPLNINVISFVFFYLVYIIATTGTGSSNIPTLFLFPVFILYQIYWSSKHGCSPVVNSVISLIIGGLLGLAFSAIIDQSGIAELQYFSGVKNQEVCNKPTKTYFKCKVKSKK